MSDPARVYAAKYADLEADVERLRMALAPFAALERRARKEFGHGPGSTCTWRVPYDQLAAARDALGES